MRHAPAKDCLTVLDFVGQAHRHYRIDSKFKALLPKTRFAIDREIELDFPHLPAGCSIQLDRISRDYVLTNVRGNLRNLSVQIPERLQTFENEANQPLTFNNFVRYHDYDPEALLVRETWSEWKAKAHLIEPLRDPDISSLRSALVRAASITGPLEIRKIRQTLDKLHLHDIQGALDEAGDFAMSIHYRLWGKPGKDFGITTIKNSFSKLYNNKSILSDIGEVLEWAEEETRIIGTIPELSFPCSLELHAQYNNSDIKAALGKATLESAWLTGVGILPFKDNRVYALLITFQKTEREFSPSTMYADYPISRELLHWESQSNTIQKSETGQNLIHHIERGYTILIFVRAAKRRNGITTPFTYLGPAECVSYESERPIKIIWRLHHPMPADIFEENRRGG